MNLCIASILKKKLITFSFLTIFVLLALSCKKSCKKDIPGCQEAPPSGLVCQAYFESWFFLEGDNTCVELGYSSCSEVGFKTEAECLQCQCN